MTNPILTDPADGDSYTGHAVNELSEALTVLIDVVRMDRPNLDLTEYEKLIDKYK